MNRSNLSLPTTQWHTNNVLQTDFRFQSIIIWRQATAVRPVLRCKRGATLGTCCSQSSSHCADDAKVEQEAGQLLFSLEYSCFIHFCRAMLCISAAYAVARCPPVCLSVRLLRSCILSQQINMSSKVFYRRVATPF